MALSYWSTIFCLLLCTGVPCTGLAVSKVERKRDKYEIREEATLEQIKPREHWLGLDNVTIAEETMSAPAEIPPINYQTNLPPARIPRLSTPEVPAVLPCSDPEGQRLKNECDSKLKKGGNYAWDAVNCVCAFVRKCKFKNFCWSEEQLKCVVCEPPAIENRSEFQDTAAPTPEPVEDCEPVIITPPPQVPIVMPPEPLPLPAGPVPLTPHERVLKAKQETDYNAPKDLHYMRGKCLDTKQVTDTYKRELKAYVGPTYGHNELLMPDQPEVYTMPEGTRLNHPEPLENTVPSSPLVMPDPYADQIRPDQVSTFPDRRVVIQA